ncbi:Uncharacterised protein [Acinetobacter baumannii]|nr:Uncharacterised protein [Acinetobacter baumannii]
MRSTVPVMPLTVTYSPVFMPFSNWMNTPVITSFTSVWAPKLMASPSAPAPASSGAMFSPTCDSTIITVMVLITIANTLRNSVSSVRSRALGRTPLLSSSARRCSMMLAISVQLNTAINRISRICTSPPSVRWPFSLPAH